MEAGLEVTFSEVNCSTLACKMLTFFLKLYKFILCLSRFKVDGDFDVIIITVNQTDVVD